MLACLISSSSPSKSCRAPDSKGSVSPGVSVLSLDQGITNRPLPEDLRMHSGSLGVSKSVM